MSHAQRAPSRKQLVSWLLILFLAVPSRVFGLDAGSLFAPAFPGDGQTADWRIINRNAAQKPPWTAIGNFLILGLGGYCSAVLVAPRIVLTANHCLYGLDYSSPDGNGKPTSKLLDATRFVFVAGVHDTFFADVIPVEEVVTGGWVPGSDDTAKDWLIAILKRPASPDILPMAFRPYRQDEVIAAWSDRIIVAAYPSASFRFSAVLRFSINCSLVKSASPGILSHDCQAEGGSSGGPIFVEEGGRLRLIGLHSSTRRSNAGQKSGVSINGFIAPLNAAVAQFTVTPPIKMAGISSGR